MLSACPPGVWLTLVCRSKDRTGGVRIGETGRGTVTGTELQVVQHAAALKALESIGRNETDAKRGVKGWSACPLPA